MSASTLRNAATRSAIDFRQTGVEKPDHRHRLLVRLRRQWQRDELAPLHVWMAPAWQEIFWRAAQRSPAVMCPAC